MKVRIIKEVDNTVHMVMFNVSYGKVATVVNALEQCKSPLAQEVYMVLKSAVGASEQKGYSGQ